jgi:hypothetical protein
MPPRINKWNHAMTIRLLLLSLLTASTLATAQLVTPTADGAQPAPQWSNLRGRIIWQGDTVPKPEPIKVTLDKAVCCKAGPLVREDLVVHPKNRGVQWVFVWLEPVPDAGPKALPVHPQRQPIAVQEVQLEVSGCKLVPHALAIREGQSIKVVNHDAVSHNVRWSGHPGKNPPVGMFPTIGPQIIKGLKADRFPVFLQCDIHPWIKGYARIFDHPYFALTDENGTFAMPLAPVGTWRLVVWQESVGWRGGAAGKHGMKLVIPPQPVHDLGNLALNP